MTEEIVKYNDLPEQTKRYVVEMIDVPRDMSFLNIQSYDNYRYEEVADVESYYQLYDYFYDAFKSNVPYARYDTSSGDVSYFDARWIFNDASVISQQNGDIYLDIMLHSDGTNYRYPDIIFDIHGAGDLQFGEFYEDSEITKSNIYKCIEKVVYDTNVSNNYGQRAAYINNLTNAILQVYKLFKTAMTRVDREFQKTLPYIIDEFFTVKDVDIILDYDEYTGHFDVIDWERY